MISSKARAGDAVVQSTWRSRHVQRLPTKDDMIILSQRPRIAIRNCVTGMVRRQTVGYGFGLENPVASS